MNSHLDQLTIVSQDEAVIELLKMETETYCYLPVRCPQSSSTCIQRSGRGYPT